MRETAAFFGYLLLCLLLAAALTPLLLATGWVAIEPHRVMGRLAQLFILLGLWPFLRWQGLANPAGLGLGPWFGLRLERARLGRSIACGWLIGVAILGALALALVELGVRVPIAWSGALALRVLEKAVAALLGGLLIGLLEELFFRGALFGALRRRHGLAATALWSAALYALLHFTKPPPLPDGAALDPGAALGLVGGALLGPFAWAHLDSLAALLAAGVFLALIRERTGHLGWCIGLHAGWVFVIGVTRGLTYEAPGAPLGWLTGGYDGVIGWLAAAWIGAVAALYWLVAVLAGDGGRKPRTGAQWISAAEVADPQASPRDGALRPASRPRRSSPAAPRR